MDTLTKSHSTKHILIPKYEIFTLPHLQDVWFLKIKKEDELGTIFHLTKRWEVEDGGAGLATCGDLFDPARHCAVAVIASPPLTADSPGTSTMAIYDQKRPVC